MWLPDEETRQKVRDVRCADVREMTYSGLTTSYQVVTISVRGTIRSLLEALQNAVMDERLFSIMPHSHTLEIHLREQSPGTGEVIRFELNPSVPRYCFGPLFQSALREAGNDESRRLRAFVRDEAQAISRLEFAGKTVPESDREAFLAALAGASSAWFDYTTAVSAALLRIFLTDGIPHDFGIIIPEPETYAPDGWYVPPLPDPLWKRLPGSQALYNQLLKLKVEGPSV